MNAHKVINRVLNVSCSERLFNICVKTIIPQSIEKNIYFNLSCRNCAMCHGHDHLFLVDAHKFNILNWRLERYSLTI